MPEGGVQLAHLYTYTHTPFDVELATKFGVVTRIREGRFSRGRPSQEAQPKRTQIFGIPPNADTVLHRMTTIGMVTRRCGVFFGYQPRHCM